MDGRADVYSLAALGFELLAGTPPFTGTPQQVMSAHVVTAPPDIATLVPDIPPALAHAIMSGLAKDAGDRPNADAFAALLTANRAPEKPVARASTDRSRSVAIAVSVVVLLGLGAYVWRARASRTADSASAANTSRATLSAPVASASSGIAVLPFETIGAPAADEYFAAGLASELTTAIGQVPGLRVASRSTVRAYQDSTLTPAALGKRLDVKALVEGTVQRAGARLRITAQLIDAVSGTVIWSERYDRRMADVFTTQTEISQAIVTALAPRLGTAPRAASSSVGTSNPDAYDLLLRGRFALEARDLQTAIELFRKALALDPKFARAQAGVAEASALLPLYGGGTHAALAPQIREAAAAASQLDSTLAAPHTALGFLAKGTGDWSTGEREFVRASALQPGDGAALQNLGELLFTLGRFDESEGALARAAVREPLNAGLVGEFAYALMLSGHLDSASRTINRAITIDGRNPFLHYTKGVIAERSGDTAGVIAPLRVAIDRKPLPFFLGVLTRALRISGDTLSARVTRAKLAEMRPAPGTTLALVIAEFPVAAPGTLVTGLSRALDEQDPLMWVLPMRLWWFDPLRARPEFAALVARLGLPAGARTPMPPPKR